MKALTQVGLSELITKTKAWARTTFINKTDVEEASTLSIDTTPTASSTNLVTSGGVATALSSKSSVSVSATGTATDEVKYITVNGTEKKLAGGSPEIFWATYGTTTYAEIKAAHDAGKEVQAKFIDSGVTLVYPLVYIDSSAALFTGSGDGSNLSSMGVTSANVWGTDTSQLIKDPTSKSSGQVLTYIGSAWVAVTPDYPLIDRTTSMLKGAGNGNAIAATAGTDYVVPSALDSYLKNNANGTITGSSSDTPLYLKSKSASSYIGFKNSSGTDLGYLGVNSSNKPVFYDSSDHELAYASHTHSNYEASANKVTSISSSSTDTQYPSAKCVYDLIGNVESALASI